MVYRRIARVAIFAFFIFTLAKAQSETWNKDTFKDPSVHVRPKFRYWLPDASVNHEVISRDIQAMGSAGTQGAELLGFYQPSSPATGIEPFAPTDWTVYGFGTDAWTEAHRENGLRMDFAIGPQTGDGVPLPDDSNALAWDLVMNYTTVPIGDSFHGVVPGWGTGMLEAVVVGLAINSSYMTTTEGLLPGDFAYPRTEVTLSASSIRDVTEHVDASGYLELEPDPNGHGLNYTIFAAYVVHSYVRGQESPENLRGPQSKLQTYLQNGTYAVDHFSALGANAITDFWEQHLLDDDIRELLDSIGNYAWEDSVEIDVHVYWTQNFSSLFQKSRGYSIKPFMPLLYHGNSRESVSTGSTWWRTDESDGGNRHILAYRGFLGEQYRIYLETLSSWAHNALNMEFSAQVSYNLPMDMLANVPFVDVPETESLDFDDLIDGYRQYVGPANLAQKPIVSSELGAYPGESYTQTLPEVLWHVKRSLVGSVNQFVLHGYPYSGDYPNSTWPVWTTFNYRYAQMHGPHEPAWEFYKDQMDYIARNNFAMQSGKTKRDLAIWQFITGYPYHIRSRTYEPFDLETAGYTYEYISPGNLNLEPAYVKDGILAPDAQGFKAFVIRANDTIPIEAVSKICQFARDGLPIVFSGGLPSYYVGTTNASALVEASRRIKQLQSLQNVHVLGSYEDLASSVADLGILPTTKLTTNGTWYTIWRKDETNGVDYFLVYNDAEQSPLGEGRTVGSIEFNVTGRPVEYNAWTGEQSPILTYTTSETSTSIPLRLAGNQTTIIAFNRSEQHAVQDSHLASVSDGILGANRSSNGQIYLKSGPGASPHEYTTATGSKHEVSAVRSASITLQNWTLVAEHWNPPANLSDIENGAHKFNTTHHLSQIDSWQEVPGLENVSGRGYYSTKFTWPPANSSRAEVDGAIIDFGPVVHTLRARVNGHTLHPLDVTSARTDLKVYLVDGENLVEAIIATPLGNVLTTVWDDLRSYGTGPTDDATKLSPPALKEYGLIRDVEVIPYKEVLALV